MSAGKLTTDAIWPRDEEHRYRLYAINGAGRALRVLAAAPDGAGIGTAMVTLAAEGEIEQVDRVGVLDAVAGSWVVNPW